MKNICNLNRDKLQSKKDKIRELKKDIIQLKSTLNNKDNRIKELEEMLEDKSNENSEVR